MMGGGSYCSTSRSVRSTKMGYSTKSAREIFSHRQIQNSMDPKGVVVRESRDSEEHPNSVAIMIGLDTTASMGTVPHHLVKDGLPNIMERIIAAGVPDPQVLFVGVGDHECDQAPLQVSQFESSDELLDKWLTDVWLEAGGGGNAGESYALAWYFAANHTSIDCFEKRGKKGLLFTIGDEPVLKDYPARDLKNIMGEGQFSDMSVTELLQAVMKTYDVYHIHISETGRGQRGDSLPCWEEIIGPERVFVAQRHTDVSDLIATAVINHCAGDSVGQGPEVSESHGELPPELVPAKEEIIL